jgi:hypothetical protein
MAVLNSVLVRWAKGYTSSTDASSTSSYGRRETFLSLTSVEDVNSATTAGANTLSLYSQPQKSVVLGIEPLSDTDTPYKGVWVRDAVVAPGADGTPTTYRVVGVTATTDAEGFAKFVPELDTKADAVADRTKLWLKRVGDGTLAGRSKRAQISRPLDAQVLSGKVEVVTPSNFSQATLDTTTSPRWQPEKTMRLTQVDATLDTPGSTSTVVVVKKNGSTVATLTLAAGQYHETSLLFSTVYSPTDYMTVTTTSVGTGAANLNVQMVGGPAY